MANMKAAQRVAGRRVKGRGRGPGKSQKAGKADEFFEAFGVFDGQHSSKQSKSSRKQEMKKRTAPKTSEKHARRPAPIHQPGGGSACENWD